ncbi:MAG TPA: alginate export family protein [Gemmatimonadales bacterium]
MRLFSPAPLPRLGLVVVMSVALLLPSLVHRVPLSWAQAGPPPSEPKRPAYQIGSAGRYNEDWSVLRGVDLDKTDDFWDRLKFIPLSPDQNVWLTLGGQARERVEYFRQFLFGNSAPKQSDGYLLSRYRLIADLHVTRYFRMFAEGKSSLALDRDLVGGRTTAFVDELDLLNGFADVMIPLGEQASVTLRGGRQELIFGSQRLVGPGDFTNVPRTWEGGAAYAQIADWTITPFWAQVVVIDQYRFNKSTSDQEFFGVFATGPLHFLPVNLDLYWLDANNRFAAFNGTPGREHRHTLGGRVLGKIGATGLDFEVEGAAQFGTVGRGDIAASMFTTVLGYTLPVARLSPRVYVEFDYASGDDRPGGDVGTFNQLFPNAHSFLGYMDYIGRQNVISPNAGISISPIKDLTLSLQQYWFWRASDRDAVYNKSSGVLRAAGTNRDRYFGAETDVYGIYNFTRHLLGYTGYSHFFTGEFLNKTGKHKDSDFYYAALQYTF